MKEYKFKINGNGYAITVNDIDDNNIAKVTVNGTKYKVEVEGIKVAHTKTPKLVQTRVVAPEPASQMTNKPTSSGKEKPVKSPLPGVILDMKVREGDAVKAGQHLMILEAMKMENNIDADRDGVIKSIKVRQGDSVLEGDVLLTIE